MHRLRALAASAALLLVACATTQRSPSLYDDLGGHDGIDAIAFDLLVRTSGDPRIAHHFAEANIVRLHEKLVELICVETGGPCTYTGAPMREAHAGRNLRDADFNALVEHLIATMEARKVPRRVQFRLLDRLAAMHGDVVDVQGGTSEPPAPMPAVPER